MLKFKNLGYKIPTLSRCFSSKFVLEDPQLSEADPEIFDLVQAEKNRQKKGIVLIASENYTSTAVNTAVGSCLTNKYSEGYPGARMYPGIVNVDSIENICKRRALDLFKLNHEEWHANVQVLSGTAANIATFNSVLNPGDRLMGLSGKSGGHFSHGFKTPAGIEAISHKFYDTEHYAVADEGNIDYDLFAKMALDFKPKLIICGYSVNTNDIDYAYFRRIANAIGAYIHLDMAHISGLIAAGIMDRPFDYVDIASTTTHKSLRGPRGGLILCKQELAERIDNSVFPGSQGGPHNHTIAGLAVALKEANTEEFKRYQRQVLSNSKALAKSLQDLGYKVRGGGTNNHMVLWDMRPLGFNASFFDKACEFASISINAIRIAGDPEPN